MMYNINMNQNLKNFIVKKYKSVGGALDLGAGDFSDIKSLINLGWVAEGVDINMGVNLEKPYLAEQRPFDLVYSNYLIHKINDIDKFINTIYDNLKAGGSFFIHTFDKSDENSKSQLTKNILIDLFNRKGLKEVEAKVFDKWDIKHEHWHKILEIIGTK